tara:strand:+ start:422 stop:1048 length:627 start_codon:yes stop_codon:yes gene_type:complete
MTIRLIKKPKHMSDGKQPVENSLWCWNNKIPKNICEKIIMSADDTWDTAKFGGRDGKGLIDPSVRKTDVHFANEDWIYNLIEPYMVQANKNANWNFDISGVESYQIGRYESSVSGHYDWHQDSLGTWNSIHNKPNRPNLHGKARKISMSLILNDDYEGGELEIFGQPKDYYGQGSIIFFPSWMLHRVTPVTKGIRYSLVMWHIGAPFR